MGGEGSSREVLVDSLAGGGLEASRSLADVASDFAAVAATLAAAAAAAATTAVVMVSLRTGIDKTCVEGS